MAERWMAVMADGTSSANFRAEVRDWLSANCPLGMREPMRGEADICWGGRKFEFTSAPVPAG